MYKVSKMGQSLRNHLTPAPERLALGVSVKPTLSLGCSGMQNVNGGRCAGPDCSKQPRFSLPGQKGKYCSKHREEGMVDVLYTVRTEKTIARIHEKVVLDLFLVPPFFNGG